jgi:large subunit ribosomal protein L22
MQVTSSLKNAPISAQKSRLVADMIRNRDLNSALNILRFTSKKAAQLILKILHSAAANAENNEGADVDALRVSAIYVDEATTLKRTSARAKGRANRISKRRCHITIKVSDEG